jgi:hypothetical protein
MDLMEPVKLDRNRSPACSRCAFCAFLRLCLSSYFLSMIPTPTTIRLAYVFSVEDAAGNSRARERVDGLKKNQAASETRHTGVSALRASPIDRTADHWLTPAAVASRLCEPVRTNAKHKPTRLRRSLTGSQVGLGIFFRFP